MSRDYQNFTLDFERCDIDAEDFKHIDHLGVAYEMLRKYDYLEAAYKYARCIDSIATAAGAAQKFNTTITLAFLSLMAERMEAMPAASFEDFMAENQDLLSRDILANRYSQERLNSDLARSIFLLPDGARAA